jgi:hypothetical protein
MSSTERGPFQSSCQAPLSCGDEHPSITGRRSRNARDPGHSDRPSRAARQGPSEASREAAPLTAGARRLRSEHHLGNDQARGLVGREYRRLACDETAALQRVRHSTDAGAPTLGARAEVGFERVPVAEHAAAKQLEMPGQPGLGVEAAPHVIEVHAPAAVQSTELLARPRCGPL